MNNEKLKIAICGYLPYGAKGLNQANIICSLEEVRMTDCIWRPDKTLFRGQAYFKVKPLLFPISSLTKTIQLADYNNGSPFVPVDEAIKITNSKINPKTIVMLLENGEFDVVPFGIINLLNRWKIDYRNFIAEGLAIEVNESNNPFVEDGRKMQW